MRKPVPYTLLQLFSTFLSVYFIITITTLVTNGQDTGTKSVNCQPPIPPVVTGTKAAICRGESVVLSATGCTGTLIWSTGETGASITVKPQLTTRYTAVCRSQQGCVSCFANIWRVMINTPDAPPLTTATALICPGDNVALTTQTKQATPIWPDGSTGQSWTIQPQQTTTYQLRSRYADCLSNPSLSLTVQTAQPTKPLIIADRNGLCAGQAVRLTATGCLGTVAWSDGGTGLVRTVTPYTTTSYRAIVRLAPVTAIALIYCLLPYKQPLDPRIS